MEGIDIAAWNSYMLFIALHPTWNAANTNRRSEFLRVPSEQLAVDHMRDRLATGHLPEELSDGIHNFLKGFDEQLFCSKCITEATDRCIFCKEPVCSDHGGPRMFIICKICSDENKLVVFTAIEEHARKRCMRCSKRRRIRTYSKCSSCAFFVCSNCSITKSLTVCETCVASNP